MFAKCYDNPTYLITYFLEQRPFWEAKKFSATTVTSARHLALSKYHSRSQAYSLTVSHHDTFLRWEVISASPNPQAGGPPLVGCPRLLIQYSNSYPPYGRPFLHLQTEDAPCHGDGDPLITHSTEFGVAPLVSLMLSCSISNEMSKRVHYGGKAWISFNTYQSMYFTYFARFQQFLNAM
jgi:hypothetical protein